MNNLKKQIILLKIKTLMLKAELLYEQYKEELERMGTNGKKDKRSFAKS